MEEFIQEILAIIQSDKSVKKKREELQDYHENDIAGALELLNKEERNRLYSTNSRWRYS